MTINKKIIPCAVHGSYRLLNSKYDYKVYPIYVHFFKPFTPEDYKTMSTQDIANKSQAMIQEKVNEFIEIDKNVKKN